VRPHGEARPMHAADGGDLLASLRTRGEPPLIAVPGVRTTAFLILSLMLGPGNFRHEAMRFDQVMDAVASGRCDARVIIHDGQLTYQNAGLLGIADLGAWWKQHTGGLPLPLGANTMRRDLDERLGPGTMNEVASLLLCSLEYALAHRAEGIEYACGFAPE